MWLHSNVKVVVTEALATHVMPGWVFLRQFLKIPRGHFLQITTMLLNTVYIKFLNTNMREASQSWNGLEAVTMIYSVMTMYLP